MKSLLLAASCALLLTAGCGDGSGTDDAGSTTPAASTVADATTPATTPNESADDAGASTPAKTTPQRRQDGDGTVPTEGSDDFSAPAEARGSDIPRVPPRGGITLKAPAGAAVAWTAKMNSDDGDTICVNVTTQGLDDRDPMCQSATQLALSFFTDQTEGHAIADVDGVSRSKRQKPSDLVISGVAAPNVRSVDVVHAGKTTRAQVSDAAIELPVDKQLAKQILDPTPEQLRSLPESVTVRVFAASIPAGANPPQRATPRTLTPVKGKLTFELS